MKNTSFVIPFIPISSCSMQKMLISGLLVLYCSILSTISVMAQSGFIQVSGRHFVRDGQPYYFMGTNFWYGLNLGSKGAGGDRERLIRELDRLQALGVNNLRIVAGSEGPDTEPWRMVPSLQPQPGVYNPEVLDGLDFLLAEMARRDMYAVVCLNNFWNWSGGMAQYLTWQTGEPIPYPPPAEGGDWNKYQLFASQFYKNEAALQAFDNHIRAIVTRQNPYTGRAYRDEPAIMAWELANEPRGILRVDAYRAWIARCAGLIKSLDPHHLVTTGSEGETSSEFAGTDLTRDHSIPGIDYATIHVWIQNWGWYDPAQPDKTLPKGQKKALKYLKSHLKQAEAMGIPLVLEEFGLSRDANSHDATAPTRYRDLYYEAMFEAVYDYARKGKALAGVNFWAWAGEGRPREPQAVWMPGDDFIGDPPHEFQGWYSVFDTDLPTQAIIRRYADLFKALCKAQP
jgi:mannan endo-1,4-beta-mannosidase